MKLPLAFDWATIWDNRSVLLHGLWLTVEVSFFGIVGALVIGVVLGAARGDWLPVVRQVAAVYVDVIRNTPFLAQLFMLYYALPAISPHLQLSGFRTAWISVAIWGGAFNTENFRAGFEAVPKRFHEAALALGFGRLATFVHVTLPIGGGGAPPPSVNNIVSGAEKKAPMS